MADGAYATSGELPDVMTFFDVESAGVKNNRMCQIGLMKVTSNFRVLERAEMLINPRVYITDIQYEIHGIGYADVKDRPAFKKAWRSLISGYFPEGCAVVGHWVCSDFAVLDKCCDAYRIRKPVVKYADTYAMAKRVFPEKKQHKLNQVCDYLGFGMEHHHDALCDVEATARAFFKMHAMHPECVEWRLRNPEDRS